MSVRQLLRKVGQLEALAELQAQSPDALAELQADPTTLMTRAGWPPDPWQRQVLCSANQRQLLLASRQCFDADTVVLDRRGRACRICDHPDAWFTGVRSVKRYTVRGGASVTVTDNHPLYGREGWVAAGSLRVGDPVAILSSWDPVQGHVAPQQESTSPEPLHHVGEDGERFHLSPLVTIEELGPRPVWDITVRDKGWLVAQGFKAHNSGKSSVAAAVSLHTALTRPRYPVLLLSPSTRQSGELFRKVMALFNALARPLAVVAESALRVEFANGSRVLSLPGTEGTVRGFSDVALLVIDEAARVPDPLYYAVRPMLAVSRGRLVALSTPFGKRGWFHDEYHGTGEWERVKITAPECPRISPEFLAEEQRALGERWFRQE